MASMTDYFKRVSKEERAAASFKPVGCHFEWNVSVFNVAEM